MSDTPLKKEDFGPMRKVVFAMLLQIMPSEKSEKVATLVGKMTFSRILELIAAQPENTEKINYLKNNKNIHTN